MIAIISSLIVVITVLLSVLVSFTPNVRAVLQTDFMRNAINNTYIYGWEEAQITRRAGGLTDTKKPVVFSDVVVGTKKPAGAVKDTIKENLGVKASLTTTGTIVIDITKK